MSSSPNVTQLDSELFPQFASFKLVPRTFVLLNSKPHSIDVMSQGTRLTVPARDVVGPKSDTDSEGQPIPGTCIFSDVYRFNERTGEEDLIFDAKFAARLILGIEASANGPIATSRYAQGGLSLIPRHADPEVWKSAAAAGEARAFDVQLDNARDTVLAWEERNAKLKAVGLGSAPIDRELQQAQFILKKADELAEKEMEARVSPHQEDSIDAEIEIMIIARAIAMEMTEKVAAGKNIDKMALLHELLNDPLVRKKAEKDWSIRRRGHLPVQREMLEAAESAGVNIVEAGLEDEREVVK